MIGEQGIVGDEGCGVCDTSGKSSSDTNSRETALLIFEHLLHARK